MISAPFAVRPAPAGLKRATRMQRREFCGMAVSGVWNDGVSMIVNNECNYPQLGNSNYMKPPIVVGAGYTNTVVGGSPAAPRLLLDLRRRND